MEVNSWGKDPRQAAMGILPYRIAMKSYGHSGASMPWKTTSMARWKATRAGTSMMYEVQETARLRRRAVDDGIAARVKTEKAIEKEGSDTEDGKWHCDICGNLQREPRPDEGAGKRYCGKCRQQWEAGWSLARQQLSEGFGTLCDVDGEVLGLCRKCGLPLGELAYCDDSEEPTLHEECMAQLKFLEVQGKELARERELGEKKRAARVEHGIGWNVTMVPCSWGLAGRLGCKLSGERGLCCLVLEGPQVVRIAETSKPAACVNLEYLALALQVRLQEGREPLFSLDPVHHPKSSKDQDRVTQVKHFDPEWLMGTAAGEVMFQADYHLKELSMGEYEQPVVGMRSMAAHSDEEHASAGWNAREWYTVRNAEVYRSADNVLIPHVEMSVEAREQVEGPHGWEDAKVTREDHPLVKYAEDFTRNFDLIAERKSVVYHLRELAKASVLAKFLLDAQVTLEAAWFDTVDWTAVKEATAKCSLEIPQLWSDRFHSHVRLHNGAALGKPDGVFVSGQSVYGGVAFGLDRFRMAAARALPVQAGLTARVTAAAAPMAGLMARTWTEPLSARHPGPRGVDLNLDKFSLNEAVEIELGEAPFPILGKEFWSRIGGASENTPGFKDAALLREVFNPHLSDRREEGDLFVSPETSASYMQKLQALVEEEAKVRIKRKERFLSKDFIVGEPGPLFPASWASTLSMGGEKGTAPELYPYSGKEVSSEDLKPMALTFDQCTEDGMRFRMYKRGDLEVRTTQEHNSVEAIGVVFSSKGGVPRGHVEDPELVTRITEYVAVPAPGPEGHVAKAPEQHHRYWLLLETEAERVVVTEKLRGGEVVWLEDPDLTSFAPNSRAVGSVACCKAGMTVGDMRKYAAQHSGKVAWPAECKRYAEDAYSRAWAFASDCWRPAAEAVAERRHGGGGEAGAARSGRLATLRRAAGRAQANREAVRAAVAADGLGLERATGGLRADRDVVQTAVRENGAALRFAASPLRNDRSVVRSAVEQDALALRHASEELRADAEIARLAVEGNSYALDLVAARVRANPALILASLRRNEFALEHAPEALLADRAFSLAAVRRNGRALESLPRKWRADRGFMLEVLRWNGFALKYASDQLRADAEVVLVALEQDARAVEYADLRGLKLDPEDDVLEELRKRQEASSQHDRAGQLEVKSGDSEEIRQVGC